MRIILNLSYPHDGESVSKSIDKNKFAGQDEMNLKYPNVEDLAKIVRKKGNNSKIFVRDLSKAYKQLFMCPKDNLYLGFTHLGKIYFDVTLSMGSASAAFCCQRTTNAVSYIYQKYGYEDVNYLDDLGAAEEENKAEEAFDCLGWILATIGIKESISKAKPPSVICVFLGILFNTLTMTLQIMPERLQEIMDLLEEWLNKKYYSLRELQSLLGKLNFACNTVRSGRIFVARIINELKKFKDDKK